MSDTSELKKFKSDVMVFEAGIVVQKYLVEGSSFYFDLHHDENEEFQFKREISNSLGVHIRDVAIVGSGKLGFSIKPDSGGTGLYRFKDFDYEYDNKVSLKKSDIDVAIISSQVFDQQVANLYDHTDCYSRPGYSAGDRNQLGKYVLKGWIRPEVLPDDYEVSARIERVRDSLSEEYDRLVNFGIYKSWYYFEKYHENNIYNIYLNLIG